MIEDWLANAYEGMSQRQFLARMSAAKETLSFRDFIVLFAFGADLAIFY